MDEAKVKEIHAARDLSGYTHEELSQADYWVKDYALNRLEAELMLDGVTKVTGEYIMLMARVHYGSVETDEFLRHHECYPEWMREATVWRNRSRP